jgi:NAD(P)-dependent dehydrogenase (short-subunit alcohol dehydrogenase family)
MQLGLSDRRVLVTGGSRGIGRECALSLAREGATVAINYVRDDVAGEKTQQDLLALGVKAYKFKADVTDLQTVHSLVAAVKETVGGIDVLVHSAGIYLPDDTESPEKWDRVIRSHLYSTYYLCHEIVEIMKVQRWGRIIAIGSIAGRESGASAYSVGKAAQSHYVRGLAATLGPHNITANVVSPGRINTDMISGTPEDWVAYARANIPVYRNRDDYPGPALVGEVVSFLASAQASYISGADLHVCGASYTGL